MKLRFVNASIIDPQAQSQIMGEICVEDGVFVQNLRGAATEIDCAGKCLAPGIVDIGVKVCEPGERHKESFRTAGRAAAAGGVTTIVTRPDTTPPIDDPEKMEFIARRAQADALVRIAPMATLTKQRLGQEMVEISLLQDLGAVAFSDCDNVIQDTRVLQRALTYAKGLGALIVGHPQDPCLSKGAAATSGAFAALKGLPSASPLAERLGLERDLTLVEMTGVKYHADNLSTAAALPLLKRAKAARLDVTAGVSIHHLTLNELDIGDYRTFFKLKPPLRSETDRLAIIDALQSGLIDVVSSMHTPQDEESKRLPFEEAASGAVGLETLLPAALRLVHAGQITLPKLWRALSFAPAERLGLPVGRLSPGAPADLVIFDPDKPFILNRFTLQSKSKNTPFDETHMQGCVLQTYLEGKKIWDSNALG